jgi:hypothetical protein
MPLFPIPLEAVLFDLFLPFIIFFSIFFILLQNLRVFGDPTSSDVKRVNLVVALCITALVVFFNPLGISFGLLLSQLFASTAMAILAIIFWLFFTVAISLVRGGVSRGWLSITLGAALTLLVFGSTGTLRFLERLGIRWGGTDLTFLAILAAVIALLYIITKA